jgi:hypothetical protein
MFLLINPFSARLTDDGDIMQCVAMFRSEDQHSPLPPDVRLTIWL